MRGFKMTKLLIATTNQGKVKELNQLLKDADYEIVSLADLENPPHVQETGRTFEQNAKLKAHSLAEYSQMPTIADDSGLCVKALHNAPGVFSARYAGEPQNPARNNAKLLSELGGVPDEKRQASFHTTIVVSFPNQPENDLVVEGELSGQITAIPRGDGGFGYDPLFFVEDKQKTLAEMTLDEKNEISHRGIAFKQLAEKLPQWLKDCQK
ncbi:nucleoside-triphosphatase [Holzapfeliella floricola DSM 23037 = JCM 16512]|uniref:dITP/XTP pyrophosphatase n=2 Tax=Holzapfeliella TaxID=2767883 RepID=A0A0R2DK93_9LACO|nr:nucleoside-triphosphatase [Holzapfeliella floricola DSM 23037 = JCM 16512]